MSIRKTAAVIVAGIVLMAADYGMSLYSNRLYIAEEDGHMYLIRPDQGKSAGHVSLEAEVNSAAGHYTKTYDISIDPVDYSRAGKKEKRRDSTGEMTAEEKIAYEMRNTVSAVNDDLSARRIALPAVAESGGEISWKVRAGTNTVAIMFATAMTCLMLYRNRKLPEKKRREAQQASIDRQLPEFTNKLVLLLNAGLVLNTAFEKSVEESLRFKEKQDDYFQQQMKEIYRSIKETNSSLSREFRAFARTAGAGPLMRISNIMSDNINKGVELTEKLQRESETLWLNRKRSCEERGRISETRLTLPLTVFLMVLIVITVSPALLEL